jgi:predicted deacylase
MPTTRTRYGESAGRKGLFYYKKTDALPKCFVIAGIHGDEPKSVSVARELILSLTKSEPIWVIPKANPDGLAMSTSYKPHRGNANGVDLNRNFPTANQHKSDREGEFYGGDPGSEPETQALVNLIDNCILGVKLIVTLHQPFCWVDYDGPGERFAREIARRSGLGLHKTGAAPGSMGTYYGVELGIPIITLELPEDEDFTNHLQNKVVAAIREVVKERL